jgi:hypothetical protein
MMELGESGGGAAGGNAMAPHLVFSLLTLLLR